MNTALFRFTRVVALLAFAAPLAAADVLVVDALGGPGSDYTQISDAVTAAAARDTILVAEGFYNGFTVDAKALVISAMPGADVNLIGTVRVQNLPVNTSLVLHGLHVQTQTNGAGLDVINCAGAIWVEDGSFEGPSLPQVGAPGARIESAAAVSFHRCSLTGSRALGEVGAPGLYAIVSNVYLFDSHLLGGLGSASIGQVPAGPGARAFGGVLYAAGGSVTGGAGGDGGGIFGCFDAGDGAPGLVLEGTGPFAQLLDVWPVGGAPGAAAEPCGPGATGTGVLPGPGEVLSQAYAARSLSADSPVVSGQPLVITAEGEPGDVVLLLVSRRHAPAFFAPTDLPPNLLLGGPLLPSLAGPTLIPFGVLGPSGTLQAFLTAPAASEATTLYMQAAAIANTPEAEVIFTSGQAVTILP